MATTLGILSEVVDVSAIVAFAVSPDINLTADAGFKGSHPSCWRFEIDGAAASEIAVSFDGTTQHGYLKAGTSLVPLHLHVPYARVWLRKVSGTTVKVIAHAVVETCCG